MPLVCVIFVLNFPHKWSCLNLQSLVCFQNCFQVFVHDGKVHIIPIPSTPGEVTIYPTGTPIIDQALHLVFGPHNTEAAAKIQKAISQRIEM